MSQNMKANFPDPDLNITFDLKIALTGNFKF